MSEVWITFACEDFVNPQTDEANRRLAELVVGNDLVAEFFFSGAKALATHRHRPDVVEYLNDTGMVIGYQGNGHSIHPVIVEYSADKDWEEGVAEARCRETQYLRLDGTLDPVRDGGIELVAEVFGRRPVSCRAPGHGWSPQFLWALREWGVSVFHTVYDLGEYTGFSTNFYLGAFHAPPGSRNRLSLEQWMDDGDAGRFARDFEALAADYPYRGEKLIFVSFHPCLLVSDVFWDALNYAGGRNPLPPDALVPSPPLSPEVAERRWQTLEDIFAFLGSRSDLEVVLPRTLADRYALTPVVLGRDELLRLAVVLVSQERLLLPDYVLVEDRVYSAAEAFDLLCQTLTEYRRTGGLPEQVTTSVARGPADGPLEPPAAGRQDISLERVIDVATGLSAGCVPEAVEGGILPSQFLFLMAEAVMALAERRRLGIVPVPPTANVSSIARLFHADWPLQMRKWPIHDPRLDLDLLTRLATLQFWSYKPAGFPW
jgi:hypothetical protein